MGLKLTAAQLAAVTGKKARDHNKRRDAPYDPRGVTPTRKLVTPTRMFYLLPLPPGVNDAYKLGLIGRRPSIMQSPRYKQWIALVSAALPGCDFADTGVGLTVELDVYRAADRGDVDQFIKPTLDGMQGVAYANDKMVDSLHVHRLIDPLYPRIEMTVSR